MTAIPLFVAASKYAIQDLKIICEKYLAEQITSENAIESLNLADLHGGEYLSAAVQEFICKRARDFPRDKLLTIDNKNSMAEIIAKLIEKCDC